MKLTITIRNGSLTGKNFELSSGFLTIGRNSECGVRFDPLREREVSTKHGYIETKPEGFYLVDNKSTNGTFVNGERVERMLLKNGDQIQFGKNGPQAAILIENKMPSGNSIETVQYQASSNFQPAPNQQFNQFQLNQFQPSSPPQQNWRSSMSNMAFQNPDVKPVQATSRKHLAVAIAIFSVVFLGLIVTLMLVSSLGIVGAFIAAVIAFVPAMFYIQPFLLIDRYDPEPPWALALSFAWGALVAVLISVIANETVSYIVGEGASMVISAPIFEEGSKGLGVVLVLIFLRKEFDDILDGIVYAGIIALGFATVENVIYYGAALYKSNGALIATFIGRGLMSPFAHVTFTAMTGIGCGISRESHNKKIRFIAPIIGYLGAVALHSFWNGVIFLANKNRTPDVVPLVYLFLEVPFFLIFVSFIGYIVYRQNKIMKEMLAIDTARGLITPEQLKISTSIFKSLFWLLGSAFTPRYKARSRFLRAIGKLGLSYWHIQRATAAQGQTASFQQNPILREEVMQWRDKI